MSVSWICYVWIDSMARISDKEWMNDAKLYFSVMLFIHLSTLTTWFLHCDIPTVVNSRGCVIQRRRKLVPYFSRFVDIGHIDSTGICVAVGADKMCIKIHTNCTKIMINWPEIERKFNKIDQISIHKIQSKTKQSNRKTTPFQSTSFHFVNAFCCLSLIQNHSSIVIQLFISMFHSLLYDIHSTHKSFTYYIFPSSSRSSIFQQLPPPSPLPQQHTG